METRLKSTLAVYIVTVVITDLQLSMNVLVSF